MKKRLLPPLLAFALLLSLCTGAAAAEGAMTFSDNLVAYIKAGEGFRAQPYQDGTGWYIGYGCACAPGDYPGGITEEEADALLREKMNAFAGAVNTFLDRYGVTVTQGQFDAMCGLSYSVGTGWLNAANRLPSILIDGVEKHSEQEIATALGVWCHVGGVPSEPLLRRRIMELKMFLYGDYSFTYDGWNWLILDPGGGSNDYSDVAVYKAGQPYGTLPTASRSGWSFAGWRTVGGVMLRATDTVAANLRLTAVWSDAASAGTEAVAGVTTDFPDVPAGIWFEEDMKTLVAAGVFSGFDDGTFRPQESVTWGQALKLVLRAAGFPEQAAEEDAHWAEGYRAYAARKHYPAPAEDALDEPATRDGIADLAAAALELGSGSGSGIFADSSRGSVLALYGAGVVAGSFNDAGQRVYKGADAISRAEICVILTRMLDYVDKNFVFVSGQRAAIDFDLKMNDYDAAAFRTASNGRVCYSDPTYKVRCGIDVSYYQGDIDWKKVAADGVEFAIIRCGYRGYGAGSLNEDLKFREYISGALDAGLDVGVYFFSQALNAAEALEEARYTLELIRGYDLALPVVFDWEQITSAGSRTRTPDWDAVTDCTVAFCDAIAAAGYTPMTYFNKTMAYLFLDMERLQGYDAWLAWYHDVPDYIYDYQMWQYGSSGSVAGIKGRVDMDLLFVK